MLKIATIMTDKPNFGELKAEELAVGDIVAWSKWNTEIHTWEEHVGILLEVCSEVKGNRIVSISRVKPLNDPSRELEFFTPTLKLVSRSGAARTKAV